MLEILQERTISITEFESKAGKIVAEARRSGKPYLITQNGKPMALLLDAKSYLDELATEALARQIATGEADIAAGKVEDLEEVLKEVRRARTVSRSRRQARQN